MDHSWGRNILKYGLGGYPCTLCARLLAPTGTVVITNQPRTDGNVYFIRVPADTLPDAPYTYELVARFAPHFPYGFAVEPDVPL